MRQRPEELVELLPEAEPFLAREAAVSEPAKRAGLVLVHDLAGDFDAAHAGALAGAHLLAGLPHEVIARFDADSLVDYRAHRPRMTFNSDRYESFAAPEILLYAMEDDAGTPFLLLHGAEPDYAWERFVAAVGQLVDRLGVTSVVALQAIPMPVPHTRPVTVTAHATRRQLIEPYPVYWGEMRIPGHVSALLELRLGEAGVGGEERSADGDTALVATEQRLGQGDLEHGRRIERGRLGRGAPDRGGVERERVGDGVEVGHRLSLAHRRRRVRGPV